MENFELLSVHFLRSFGIFHQLALCSALIVLISRWLKKRKYPESSCAAIPHLKTPVYSILGNLRVMPSNSTLKKTLFPKSVFLVQIGRGYTAIFEKEKIFSFRIAFERFVILNKPESVEEFLSTSGLQEKPWFYDMLSPLIGTGLVTSGGSKWKSWRKLLNPCFNFSMLRQFVPIFDEHSKVLVKLLKGRHKDGYIDVVSPVKLCALDIICETTLGVVVGAQTNGDLKLVAATRRAAEATMERMSNPLVYSDIIFSLTSAGKQFKQDVNYIKNISRKIIRQRKEAIIKEQNKSEPLFDESQKNRRTMLDLLIDVHMKSPDFTEEDIREETDTIIAAGHDTIAIAASWALYLIGLYPEIQSKIHEELDVLFGDYFERPVTMDDINEMHYLECVLKESQRLYPSVSIFARKAETDINLCGHRIKKGTTIIVAPYAIHRNSEAFPNPEKFDPDRFLPENCVCRNPFSYIPFSAGARNCIGQRFAMLEEKTLVANVLRSFSVKSLEHRDQVLPSAEIVLHPVHPLKLKFTPRERE